MNDVQIRVFSWLRTRFKHDGDRGQELNGLGGRGVDVLALGGCQGADRGPAVTGVLGVDEPVQPVQPGVHLRQGAVLAGQHRPEHGQLGPGGVDVGVGGGERGAAAEVVLAPLSWNLIACSRISWVRRARSLSAAWGYKAMPG